MDGIGSTDFLQAESVPEPPYGNESLLAAPGLSFGWAMPPVLLEDAFADAYRQHNSLQANRWLESNRRSVASMLMLANHMDSASEAEIHAALDAQDPVVMAGLFNSAMSRIEQKLSSIQTAINSCSVFMGIGVGTGEDSEGCLSLSIEVEPVLVKIPVLDLPEEHAKLVFSAIRAIADELSFGLVGNDLLEQDWFVNAVQECLKEFSRSGVSDIADWAEIVMDKNDMEVCEFYESASDLADALQEFRDESYRETPDWMAGPYSVEKMQRAHSQLRAGDPTWKDSPWSGFVGETLRQIESAREAMAKALHDFGDECEFAGITLELENGCMIDSGNLIGVGAALEIQAADSLYEQMQNAGEIPMLVYALKPETVPLIALKLELIAVGQGLLSWGFEIGQQENEG